MLFMALLWQILYTSILSWISNLTGFFFFFLFFFYFNIYFYSYFHFYIYNFLLYGQNSCEYSILLIIISCNFRCC
ncbi:hypothetical protein U3516DRAFT_916637 [Neocallimastix sp. 'constans']